MKQYEVIHQRKLIPLLPIMARLDGRNFHTFTKGLRRPYDERLSHLMIDVTKFLVEDTNALVGYTQSDEISLVWYSDDPKSQIFFDGRIEKIMSVLSATCSVEFVKLMPSRLPEKIDCRPTFDCRVWNVPNLTEAANTILWREMDATKNSISMAAQHYYSPKELHKKNSAEKHELLFQKGVNWNNYPFFFKRGIYVMRTYTTRLFTAEELDKLPPKHQARTNPALVVKRSGVTTVNLPPLKTIKNREEVLFQGAEPQQELPDVSSNDMAETPCISKTKPYKKSRN